MPENKYFKNALSDFVFDMADGGAIRHLSESGYTVKQIVKRLDFPVSYEKVQKTVWENLLESRVVLLDEPGDESVEEKVVYVEDRTRFGKISFRRTVIPGKIYQPVKWSVSIYGRDSGIDLSMLLSEKCRKNNGETAYGSCDFGILKAKDLKQYQSLMGILNERQKEYIEGLLWPRKRVYHRMDTRMSEILFLLVRSGNYTGSFYFRELEEKIIIK